MQRVDYHGMNAGVREGLHYGSLILGLMAIALMCLLAWLVTAKQVSYNNMPLGRIPPVMILIN
jgi:hypothetical protein